MITDKKLFHLEITVTDQQKTKRRLIFAAGTPYSYSKDNIIKQPLHARIPCDMIRDGVWLNLQFDIQSFVEICFGDMNFRSIDSIMIAGGCRLRKIMTMKNQIIDNTGLWLAREYGSEIGQEYEEQFASIDYQSQDLPGNLNFQNGVEYMNQVVSYDKILFWGYIIESINSSNSPGDNKKNRQKPEIAFGTRFTSKPILEEQQKLRSALGNIKDKSQSPQRMNQGEGIQQQIIGVRGSPSQNYHKIQNKYVGTAGSKSGDNSIQKRMRKYSGENYDQYSAIQQTPLTKRSLIIQERQISQDKFEDGSTNTNVDFTQYRLSSVKQTGMRSQDQQTITQKSMVSRFTNNSRPAIRQNRNGSPQIDDNYLNEKIKYLQAQRLIVHQMAEKYGIPNYPKVEQLSLITVLGNGNKHHSSSNLISLDPKERIREYHQQVYEKRKLIHQKQLIKRQQEAAQEEELNLKNNGKAKYLKRKRQDQNTKDEGQENNQDQQEKKQDQQDENNLVKVQKSKANQIHSIKDNENVQGWDNEEGEDQKNDQEGDDYGDEKENDQQNEDYGDEIENEEKENIQNGDDYGEEVKEKGAQNEDYGEEEGQDEEAAGEGEDYGAEEEY